MSNAYPVVLQSLKRLKLWSMMNLWEDSMEQQFGETGWDIYANHKGGWCLYKSQLCQEDSGCINCEIHREAENKWQEFINVKQNRM
jgi:hypothetical protein